LGRAKGVAARSSKLRALPFGDSDSPQERFFRRRGIGGVALQQDVAARAMQFGFERAIAQAIGRRQRFIEDRNGAILIARGRRT
jgi:hypothetical protein